ncbi:MAG: hypothetical protein J6V92_08115 [Bacteroidaceae bacterium]|nr:hypothetical protein [Bacteroidaceae bacterium]
MRLPKAFLAALLAMAGMLPVRAEHLWVEAESFAKKGGWVVDPMHQTIRSTTSHTFCPSRQR